MRLEKKLTARVERALRFWTSTIKEEGIKRGIKFSDRWWETNAGFFGPIRISRGLFSELTESELKAVGLHEIAHVKYKHFRKKALWALGPFFVLVLLMVKFLAELWTKNSDGGLWGGTMLILLFIWNPFIPKKTQWTELQADSYAKKKLGSQVTVRALRKVDNYYRRKRKKGRFLAVQKKLFPTHPGLEERIKNLKENLVPAP